MTRRLVGDYRRAGRGEESWHLEAVCQRRGLAVYSEDVPDMRQSMQTVQGLKLNGLSMPCIKTYYRFDDVPCTASTPSNAPFAGVYSAPLPAS